MVAPAPAEMAPAQTGQAVEVGLGHDFEIKIKMKMKKGRDCELSLNCDQYNEPITSVGSSAPAERYNSGYSPGSLFLLARRHLVSPKNQRRWATGFWGCLKI